MKTELFHRELGNGIYQLSSSESGYSVEPGKANRNSYLICGKEKALLFDLALKEKGLKEYAQKLSNLPVMVVLSHCHIDHIFNINEVDEVYIHPDDEKLLKNGAKFQKPVKNCPKIHYLNDSDTIDLGDRLINVIHISGHTDGSILLYDGETKLLLSGDTVARRILYGMHTFVPFDAFCESLAGLNCFDIEAIYSCHDRCALPFERIYLTINMIRDREKLDKRKQWLPGVGIFTTYNYKKETDIDYFNMAVLNKNS